jgi:serine/threonine protein kinase
VAKLRLDNIICGMQVLLVRKKDTTEVFAMKVLNKKTVVAKRQVEHTQTERAILESMDHPFLIKLRYAFQSRMNLYLVMPYVAGGELFQRLRVHRLLPEEWVQFYAAEIALGIGHLHACGIVFRDLKPENVLIDRDGHVILSDFGLAKILDSDDDMTNTFCGTPEYIGGLLAFSVCCFKLPVISPHLCSTGNA